MKHLFIINPAAGSRDRTEKYTKKIEKICAGKGGDFEIRVSQAPGNCTVGRYYHQLHGKDQ